MVTGLSNTQVIYLRGLSTQRHEDAKTQRGVLSL